MYEKEIAHEIAAIVARQQWEGLGECTEQFEVRDLPSENGCFMLDFDGGSKFIVVVQQVSE